MIVKSISLDGFRNYDSEKVDFDPGINVIVGQRKAVEIAVKVTETHNRYTQLAWRLREYRD